ncbi:RICIN domain-containing protein [Kitasatospora sp. NPDC015120]|uniref:RICIN domain-containing protein n=1 Tax=Kitasatospora sp. NPDC015120 TaxID=3364023 RepID=UPI0036F46598
MSLRPAAALLALTAALALTAPAAHAATGAPDPLSKPFSITNLGSEKCLEVADWRTDDGAPVRQWTCTGGANQQWYWAADRVLVNAHSGTCLDVPGFSTAPGTRPVVWTCNRGTNQQWTEQPMHSGTRRYANVNSALVLDVAFANTADGAPVIQWNPIDTPVAYNQIWFPSDFTPGPTGPAS